MSKKLRLQLKELHRLSDSINADELWVTENKTKLFAQIANTVRTEEKQGGFSFANIEQLISIFIPKSMAAMARPLLVVAIAIGATVGGWVAGVSASQNSLPGDALYGVKLATEKTQVTVAVMTGDKGAETQLHLKFAGRRSQEVKKVIENDHPDASKRAEEAIVQLKKSVESARQTVQDVGDKDIVQAVVLAKDVSKRTTEINKDLTEATAVAKAGPSITKEMAETKEIVTASGLDTIRMIVEKTAQADEKTSDSLQKQVTEIVAEKISALAQDKQASVNALKTLTDIPVPVITPAVALNTSLTKPLLSTTTSGVVFTATSTGAFRDTVKDIVQKVDKSGVIVDKIIGDAKVLVEQKNFVEAIEKAREASKVNNETTRAVSQATETVNKILTEPSVAPIDPTRVPAQDVRPVDTATSSPISTGSTVTKPQ